MQFISVIKILFLSGLISVIFACGNSTVSEEAVDDHDHESSATSDHDEEKGENGHEEKGRAVHLTVPQIQAIGLETGTFTEIKIAGYFTTNGTIDLPPRSIAKVNAPESGFVKEVENYVVGSYVKEGAVLAVLEHPLYIQKQQEYLETASRLKWLEQDLERQKMLSEANVSALKAKQKAESEVIITRAQQEGLKQYLEFLGINTGKVLEGEITRWISLKAPLSGFITAVNVSLGILVSPGSELYEIVNNEHIHLELNVFEKDISRLKEHQQVTFTIPALGKRQFKAKVHEIGRSFDAENKSLRVHCHIVGEHPRFVRGLYAEARIWEDESTVDALPEDAIVRDGGFDYIFIKGGSADSEDEVAFKPVKVVVGKSSSEFVEVRLIDTIPTDAEIVTRGAYYLIAEMNKGAVEHNH
jgi:membrane fusion protein, heavy metal efflux system